jgi:hypothetical protein
MTTKLRGSLPVHPTSPSTGVPSLIHHRLTSLLRPVQPLRVAAAFVASALLASCSGGGGTSPTTSTQSKHAMVNIKISGSGTQSKFRQSKLYQAQHQRRTKYVSVATNGIAVYVYAYGGQPGSSPTAVADVSATSPYCTIDSDGSGDRICGIPISAPVGADDFLIDGYDQPPANGQVQGNELETGTAVDVTITPSGPNQINVTFDGIISSLNIVPIWQTSQNDGTAHQYSFSVNAYDADNYVIIDTVPFANALTVVIQNDPNKTLSLTAPGSGQNPSYYTLNYNGGTVNDAQIIASAAGVTQTTTEDFTPMIVIPTKLTIQSGGSGTFTAQMAVPADQTPQSYQQFVETSEEPSICGPTQTGGVTEPWTNGNPVTFTVTSVGTGGGCSIAMTGPETTTGYALQTVAVTIQGGAKTR